MRSIIQWCPILPCKKTRSSHPLQISAQIPRDHEEGRSSRIVDANLHVLKVRIEEVRAKERWCVADAERGWNYENYVIKRNNYQEMGAEFVELLGMAVSTLGFTIFSCTFALCLISFLLHLH